MDFKVDGGGFFEHNLEEVYVAHQRRDFPTDHSLLSVHQRHDLFVSSSAGNVGIGTTTVTSPFVITKSSNLGGAIFTVTSSGSLSLDGYDTAGSGLRTLLLVRRWRIRCFDASQKVQMPFSFRGMERSRNACPVIGGRTGWIWGCLANQQVQCRRRFQRLSAGASPVSLTQFDRAAHFEQTSLRVLQQQRLCLQATTVFRMKWEVIDATGDLVGDN